MQLATKPITSTTAINLRRCNTMGQAHAYNQWRLSQWRGLSDGRRTEQPRTGALVNIHRLKSCNSFSCFKF